MACHDIQPVNVCGIDSLMYVGTIDDTLVYGAFELLYVDTESAGGIRLRVGIDNENRLLHSGERRGKVYRRCCLADTAFLVGKCNYLSHCY